MKFQSKFIRLAQISLLSSVFSAAQADPGQFYIAPGLQWMDFDDEVMLDNDAGFSAGLGFQLAERWSIELATFDMDPEDPQGSDVDLDHYRLDLFYDIGSTIGEWQPFVVGGIGNTEFGDSNDTLAAVGAGLKYDFNDNWQWRIAARTFAFLGRDLEDRDHGIDASLIYFFGGRESSPSRPSSPARPTTSSSRPSTPARTREEVSESVPVRDADGDGVADSGDACPETPRNYAVDERGCPIPVEEVARVELLVNFDFDRSEVKSEYFDEIEEVTDFMEQYPDVVVELEGHTDSRGTDEYNQGLSERRAAAVRQVMIDRFGISAGRITARGFGESQPVASNDTDTGRARNRRVITVIIKTLQNYQPR
ncbi:MAG: OmpA family protein [Pseudomonadales bacterium]|nr:OmpA family protein [Pseudomonadales bacterium]